MKAKYIAQDGILIGLTLVILYSTSIIPISTLSILTLASCLIPICIIRTSIKNTFLVYISASILSFFLVPIKISMYYFFFFGIYGIIKHFIEKHKNRIVEIVLKLITFNILLSIIYFISINLFVKLNINYSLYILLIISEIAFLIYDYALTIIISIYLNRIHKHI